MHRMSTAMSRLISLVVIFAIAFPVSAFADIFELPVPLGTSITNPGLQSDYDVVWREGWGNSPLAQYTFFVPQPIDESQPAIVGAYYTVGRPSSVTTINAGLWPECYNAVLVSKTEWGLYVDLPGEAGSPGPLFNRAAWVPPAGVTLNRPYEGPYDLAFQFFAKDTTTAAGLAGLRLGLDMTPPRKVTGIKATPGYGGPLVNGWLTQSRVHLDWDDLRYDDLAGTGYFEVFMDGKPYPTSSDDPTSRRVYDLKEHYPGYGFVVNTRRGLTIEDLPAGEHVFQVRAVDRATNPGPLSDPLTIKCDPDIPTVKITSPEVDGLQVSAKPTFAADVTDLGGVSAVEFYVDGVLKATDSAAPYSVQLDLSGFADKSQHTLKVVARDVVNRTNFAESIFVIDKTPKVSIVSPPVPGAIMGNPAILSAAVSDDAGIASVVFAVDGSTVSTYVPTAGESTSTIALALATLSSGAHTVVVTVNNVVGGTVSSTRAFTIDDALPVSTLLLAPPSTEETALSGTSDTNPYTATDADTFWRQLWGNSANPQFTITAPTYEVQEQVELFYGVDRTPFGRIDPNQPSSFFRSTNVAGTISLNDIDQLGVLLADPSLDGTLLYPGKANAPIEGVWFWHLLYRNASGSISAEYDLPYGIDVTPPNKVADLSIFRDSLTPVPVNAWINQDRALLRWSNAQQDLMSGTAYYRVYVDGVCAVPGDVPVLEPSTGSSGVPWYRSGRALETLTIERMGPGKHTVAVTAVDRAGNESVASTSAAVWVDPDVPTVSIRTPATSNSLLGLSSYLSAKATDGAGVSSVKFAIDGITVGTVRPSTLATTYVANFKPNWASIPNGKRQVTVTVTDMVGRTAASTRIFNLDRTAPTLTSTAISPNPFFPLPDGYRDKAKVSFRGSGYTTVTLEVARPGSRPANYKALPSSKRWYVKSSSPRSAFWYDGKSASGAEPLPATATSATRQYWARIVLRDAAGNLRYSTWRTLTARTAPQLIKLGPDTVQVIQR